MSDLFCACFIAGLFSFVGFSAGKHGAEMDVCAAIYGHEPTEMVFKDNHCVLKSETALEMKKP